MKGKTFWWLLILGIMWLFAGLPLLLPGFIPTHDGEYHIIRIYEFYTMLRSGYPFPRWAPGLNSGYGIPLFNFHYPFPNYIGSLFHAIGFSLVDSFKLTLFTGYVAAVLACFWWLKKLFGSTAAAIGTVIFSFVPYWFVDIYVRGSVGEVLAMAFVMVSLASVENRKHSIFAIAIAGLIISHNILAMLFVPILLFYSLLRNRYGIRFLLLGIALSAYFWLPALAERSYVTGLNSVNFKDHFPDIVQLLIPSWGTGFSNSGASYDEMSQQVGIIPLIVFFLSCIFWLKSPSGNKKLLGFFICLSVISFFLMLPSSIPVWNILIPMQFLQYPWRLLSIGIPAAGVFAAFIATKTKMAIVFAILAVCIALPYVRPVTYAVRRDLYYLTRKTFTDGTSSLGNSFSTIWTPWKKERAQAKAEIVEGNGSVQTIRILPLFYEFTVTADVQSRMRVNTLYYPGWTVFVDGKETPIDTTGGVITITVLPGTHVVTVQFRETPVRLFADGISILGLFWLVALSILKYIYAHRH